MVQFYIILIIFKSAEVNADLLWWNRNRNNDLFQDAGKRFHLHYNRKHFYGEQGAAKFHQW